MTRNQRNNFNVHAIMDVPEGAYGAYAYAPGVGLGMASDSYEVYSYEV